MLTKILSFFLNLNKSENKNLKILDGIYFHEDFFKQVEFCPRENFEYLIDENKKISKFGIDHSDGDGLFTDIYLREKNNEVTIFERKILLTNLEVILVNLGLVKVPNVYSGYSTLVEKCNNAIAYKLERAEIFIFFEKDYIKDFFVNGFRFHEDQIIKDKLQDTLFKIGTEYDLILNDWDLTEIIDLIDKKEIEKYLNEEF